MGKGQPLWDHKNTKVKHENLLFPRQLFLYFLLCMCPAICWANKRKQNTKMKRISVGYWPSKSLAPHHRVATNNAINQSRPQRCQIQWTSVQSRLLRQPPQPRSLHWLCFRHPSRPHTTTGGQIVYRSDTIVVLVAAAARAAIAVVAVIWSSLGTSRPQRQIFYSASKGVNSSVDLCFFCGHLQK